ncbi:MAG: hypothetical protein RJA70_1172 [Pseudomonadota bacterium]|jgi:MYXO-CTERM domain-containing protein
MRSFGLFSATLALVFLASGVAAAHLTITDPPDRGGAVKEGPCEGKPRGTTPKAYTGGAKVTIKWTETIEHEMGFFRISLDPTGDKFDADNDGVPDHPVDRTGAFGNGNESLKLLDIPDRDINMDGKPDYTAEITLPNIDCTACTLQVQQMMGDKVSSAGDLTNHIYYRCADITITKDAAAGGTGGGAAQGGAGGGAAQGGAGGGAAQGGAGGGAAQGGAGGTATGGAGDPAQVPVPMPTTPAPTTPPVATGPVVPPPPSGTAGAAPVTGGGAPATGSTSDDADSGCAVVGTKSTGASTAWGLALVGLVFAWRKRRGA